MTSIHVYETFGIVRKTRTNTMEDPGTVNPSGINLLIVGGESGPGSQPFEVNWARDLIQQ
jgi:protein gp37